MTYQHTLYKHTRLQRAEQIPQKHGFLQEICKSDTNDFFYNPPITVTYLVQIQVKKCHLKEIMGTISVRLQACKYVMFIVFTIQMMH